MFSHPLLVLGFHLRHDRYKKLSGIQFCKVSLPASFGIFSLQSLDFCIELFQGGWWDFLPGYEDFPDLPVACVDVEEQEEDDKEEDENEDPGEVVGCQPEQKGNTTSDVCNKTNEDVC